MANYTVADEVMRMMEPARVDLKPYPFPEGMDIPRLMPFQEYPWNGDGYLAAEVLRLKKVHGLTKAIETGTCLGSTTCWLAENFDVVHTIDVNAEWQQIAYTRQLDIPGEVKFHTDDSAKVLNMSTIGDGWFMFADAHWNQHCPLLDELKALAFIGAKPVIAIHDMRVPGHPELGFDRMLDGTPFSFELVKPYLDRVYGEDGYTHHFNEKAEGAMRGVLYIEPKTK